MVSVSHCSLAKNFQQSYIEGGGQFYSFCNKVFASWDFCITDEKTAKIRSQNFINDIEVQDCSQSLSVSLSNLSSHCYIHNDSKFFNPCWLNIVKVQKVQVQVLLKSTFRLDFGSVRNYVRNLSLYNEVKLNLGYFVGTETSGRVQEPVQQEEIQALHCEIIGGDHCLWHSGCIDIWYICHHRDCSRGCRGMLLTRVLHES